MIITITLSVSDPSPEQAKETANEYVAQLASLPNPHLEAGLPRT